MLLAIGVLRFLRWREERLQHQARHLQTLIDSSTADILEISHIGRELTSTLDTEQAFDQYTLTSPLNCRPMCSISALSMTNRNACLNLVHKYEGNRRQRDLQVQLSELRHPAVWCVQIQEDVITNARHELANYLRRLSAVRAR